MLEILNSLDTVAFACCILLIQFSVVITYTYICYKKLEAGEKIRGGVYMCGPLVIAWLITEVIYYFNSFNSRK